MFLCSRFFSTTAIHIKHGQAHCVKGKMMQHTLRSISDVCQPFNIPKGEIWINGAGRIHFSSSIPKDAHQRLRNCLAQQ